MRPKIAFARPVAAPAGRSSARHGWPAALAVVLATSVAMLVVAAAGLWAAGAADLPKGAFRPVLLATVVTAVGGTVELSGNAGELARTNAGLTVVPLSVTLVGALVAAGGFLRPLRHRAVAGAGELAGWAARIAVLWLLASTGLASGARHTFAVDVGSGVLSDLAGALDAAPRVGFTTDVPGTAGVGLLWLAGMLLLALLVSRGAPLPGRLLRFQASVRPAAYAMVALMPAYVALALVIALVTMVTRGHARETLAVILLGLPNLAWLALTLGLGATWKGRGDGPFGLPVPKVLTEVLGSRQHHQHDHVAQPHALRVPEEGVGGEGAGHDPVQFDGAGHGAEPPPRGHQPGDLFEARDAVQFQQGPAEDDLDDREQHQQRHRHLLLADQRGDQQAEHHLTKGSPVMMARKVRSAASAAV
nr:streptophobe family protein [Streptomyces shenzhenensis]